jgi:hypothetical protein
MTDVPSRRAAILAEIERLQTELRTRRSAERRPPTSVVRAYQELLSRHFAQLDRMTDRAEPD